MAQKKTLMTVAATVWIGSLVVFGIVSCVTEEKKEPSNLKADEQKVLEEYRAEIEVGRNMAGRLLQFYGTVGNESLLTYVDSVLSYVGRSSEFAQTRFMVEIIDSDTVNAFACPGGYILITSGAIRHAKNEAELAHVLAHEITHVGKKHMFDTIKKMNVEEIEEANKLASQQELDQINEVRKRPDPDETNVIATEIAKYISGGSLGVGIIQAAGAGMGLMLEKGLGAEKEYEADFHGVRYAVNAGYDPHALTQFLCRLKYPAGKNGLCTIPSEDLKKVETELAASAKDKEAVKEKGKVEDSKAGVAGDKVAENADSKPQPAAAPKTVLDKTHPPVAARAINIAQSLAEIKAQSIVGAKGTKRFLGFQKLAPRKVKEAL